MTNFKKYLGYRLKKSLLRTVAFSLLSLAITYIYVYMNVHPFFVIGAAEYRGSTGMDIFTPLMTMLCILVPILETAEFKNKRNLDTFYSLPLSRLNVALAHFISGFLQVAAVYTASFICMVLTVLPYAEHYRLWYLPAFYIFSLIMGLGMYSFYSFLFGQANTVFDGALFCVMWSYGTVIVFGQIFDTIRETFEYVLHPIAENDLWKLDFNVGFPFSALGNINLLARYNIEPKNVDSADYDFIMRHYWSFLLWALIFALCAYGYFRTFARKGAENAGEVSDTWFGYRLIIPVYGSMMFGFGEGSLSVIWLVMMLIGYTFYRRGLKLKKSDIAVMLVYALLFMIDMPLTVTALLASTAAVIVCLCLFMAAKNEKDAERMKKYRILLAVFAVTWLVSLALSGFGLIAWVLWEISVIG